MPWIQLLLHEAGEIDTCCMAPAPLPAPDGSPLLVSRVTIGEAWNSPALVAMRREMAQGRWPDRCASCRRIESVGESYRQKYNRRYVPLLGKSARQLADESAAADYRLSHPPRILRLNLGNLCNLGCRMCSPLASSLAAEDPVLSKWRKVENSHRWNGARFRLGPEPSAGVEQSGVICVDDGYLTDGQAVFRSWWSGQESLKAVEIGFLDGPGGWWPRKIEVFLNGKRLGRLRSPGGAWTRRWEVTRALAPGPLELCVKSGLRGGRGVGLSSIHLLRPERAASSGVSRGDFFGRFPENPDWPDVPGLIETELMPDPASLLQIIAVGGEPMLMPRFHQLLDRVAMAGHASRVGIQFSTNVTSARPSILGRLEEFREVMVFLSIDGIGPVNSYVRWPAKWDVVERTLNDWQARPGFTLRVAPTIMAYTLPGLKDLLVYCKGRGLEAELRPCLHSPPELGVVVLPPDFRRRLAQELLELADGDAPLEPREGVLRTAREVLALGDAWPAQLVDRFIAFTRDLDRQRGQSFALQFPDIAEAFAKAGRPWPTD